MRETCPPTNASLECQGLLQGDFNHETLQSAEKLLHPGGKMGFDVALHFLSFPLCPHMGWNKHSDCRRNRQNVVNSPFENLWHTKNLFFFFFCLMQSLHISAARKIESNREKWTLSSCSTLFGSFSKVRTFFKSFISLNDSNFLLFSGVIGV